MMKRILNELNFFKVIENAEEKTQKKISSEISTSIGFANALIKKFLKKGIIKVKQAPYKRFIYYLTPDGFANKIKLVKEYIDESLNFFRKIRKEFNEVIVKDNASGFYLYGAGEICEIAILSLQEKEKKIVAIIDTNTKQKKYFNYNVIKKLPKNLGNKKIILTSKDNAQEIYFDLIQKVDKSKLLVINSLYVSKKKPNFKPTTSYDKKK